MRSTYMHMHIYVDKVAEHVRSEWQDIDKTRTGDTSTGIEQRQGKGGGTEAKGRDRGYGTWKGVKGRRRLPGRTASYQATPIGECA